MSNTKKEFIERMSTKLVIGKTITNEDIMRGILMILQDDAVDGHTPSTTVANDDFDAKAVALAFYQTNKTSTDKEQRLATKELKKELSYIEYMKVVNEISNIDDNRYLVASLLKEMGRVID